MKNKKPNVFIVCTGVGHINRGYESFTKECFAAINGNEDFNLYMLKGAGPSVRNEISVNCVIRNSKQASFISKLIGKETYWIEQSTFLISIIPYLIKYKPSVIFYSDFILGTFFWHLQRFFKFKYRLLFSNGAPNGPPFSTMHHVQQLLPTYVETAVAAGAPAKMQTLLPYGFDIDLEKRISKMNDVQGLRNKLSLPQDKKIIISVGAINTMQKRMDYVVNEFANLDQDKFFLLMLGQVDEDSLPVQALAAGKLNKDNYIIKQVPGEQVSDHMAASDYFILGSLKEGLPRVLPEALSNGLIPIVHDYVVTRQTLQKCGVFRDFTTLGVLASAIDEVDSLNLSKEDAIRFAWKTYSWDMLKTGYIDMINKVINEN